MPAKGKRAASAVAKEESKKPRIDPKLVPVTSAISQMEHLPERCKQMLIMMLAPSLKGAATLERHEIQKVGLQMIEETLEHERLRIEALVSESEQKLANFNSLKASRDGEQSAAEAQLAARKDEEQTQRTLLAEMSQAEKSAEKAFSEAQEAKAQGGKTFEANTQEKNLLEQAFVNHYKIPMDANEGPHFPSLQPLLGKFIKLDESLLSALPSSCVKTKEQRGSFDEVVLDELQKAFSAKIEELRSSLEAEGLAAMERDSKVQATEADLESKKIAVQDAVAAYEVAQVAVKEAEQEASNAKLTATSAVADVHTQEKVCEVLKLQLSEFEGGVVAAFHALKEPPQEVAQDKVEAALDKVEAAEEVACGGA